jgi:cytochrome c5
MPAWSQTHGGPFTDQQVSQLVAYLRSWEADAPDRLVLAMAGDPVAGLTIYSSKCVICHGENGSGSERAPALNDPIKLSQLDDDWYADTIAQGRPAQGMPTWGTVLAPTQIQDLVALLRAWEHAEDIQLPGPQEPLDEALHLLEHGDLNAVAHALEEAEAGASGDARVAIQEAISAAEQGDQEAVETAIMRAQSLIGLEPDHADEEQHDQ